MSTEAQPRLDLGTSDAFENSSGNEIRGEGHASNLGGGTAQNDMSNNEHGIPTNLLSFPDLEVDTSDGNGRQNLLHAPPELSQSSNEDQHLPVPSSSRTRSHHVHESTLPDGAGNLTRNSNYTNKVPKLYTIQPKRSLELDLIQERKRRAQYEEENSTLREVLREMELGLKLLQRCNPDGSVRDTLERHLRATQELVGRKNSDQKKIEGLSVADMGRRFRSLNGTIRDICLTSVETSDQLPNLETAFGPSVQSWADRAFGKDM